MILTVICVRYVRVFKNWKLFFENICENIYRWKNVLKYVKCCLKTKNSCLKTQTKHPYLPNNIIDTRGNHFSKLNTIE